MSDPKMIKEIMEAVSIPVRRRSSFSLTGTSKLTSRVYRSWPSRVSDMWSRPRSCRPSA